MKVYIVVEYETGGGHGEADAVEEALRNLIENGTPYKVRAIRSA